MRCPCPLARAGHAEPDRAGRHLPAARGAAGPLHVQADGALPGPGHAAATARRVAGRRAGGHAAAIADAAEVRHITQLCRHVLVGERCRHAAVDLVVATQPALDGAAADARRHSLRRQPAGAAGAGAPRACARCWSAPHVDVADLDAVALPVLRHRVLLRLEKNWTAWTRTARWLDRRRMAAPPLTTVALPAEADSAPSPPRRRICWSTGSRTPGHAPVAARRRRHPALRPPRLRAGRRGAPSTGGRPRAAASRSCAASKPNRCPTGPCCWTPARRWPARRRQAAGRRMPGGRLFGAAAGRAPGRGWWCSARVLCCALPARLRQLHYAAIAGRLATLQPRRRRALGPAPAWATCTAPARCLPLSDFPADDEMRRPRRHAAALHVAACAAR